MVQDSTDSVFAAICIICFLVGVPCNIVALRFFIRKTRDIPAIIYMSIAATDLATSILVLPVGISMGAERRALMFGSGFFCSVWGFTYELIPYFSVFLVFALSSFRTFALLRPMKRVTKKFVWWVLFGYLCFLIGRQLVGVFAGYTHYKYEPFSGYCWNHINNTNWQYADSFFSFFQLAFPIIPITLSCILSTSVIYRSLSLSAQQACVQRTKRKATVTIIIVTSVYILFNVPVFVNYARYTIGVYIFKKDFLAASNANKFLQKYVWILTYVMVVALNSLTNPFVYMLRMTQFREAILPGRKGRAKKPPTHSHTEQFTAITQPVVIANNSRTQLAV